MTGMKYDLNDLYYFVKVVEYGGFSPAGEALGIPKSRLSRRIADLEQKLNISLIYRSTRQFHVTEVGQTFYQQCKNVIAEAEIAEEIICSVQGHPRGSVKFSCPVALLQAYLQDLLTDFMVKYPDIDVQILAVNRPVDVISEGFDLALRVRSLPLDDSGLTMKVLGYSRRVLVASPLLFAIKAAPQHPDELTEFPILANSEQKQNYALTLTGEDGSSITKHLTARLATTDVMTLHRAACKGLGIARLPEGVVLNDLNAGRLVRVLPGWQFPEDVIHAVFPSRKGLLPAVQALLNYLAERVPQTAAFSGQGGE